MLGALVVMALAQPADAPRRGWLASASPVRSVLGATPTPPAAPSGSETLIGAGTWCSLFGVLIGGSGVGLAIAFNHLEQPLGSSLATSIALPLMVTGGALLLVGLPALIESLHVGTPHTVDEFWREVHHQQRASLDAMEASPRTFKLISRTGAAVLAEPSLQARLMPLIADARATMRAFWQRGQALGAVRGDVSADQLMAMLEAVKRAAWQSSFAPDHVPTIEEVEDFAHKMLDYAKRLAAPAAVFAPSPEVP